MKDHFEMFKALISGDTLISTTKEYKLIDGVVNSRDRYDITSWIPLAKPPRFESVSLKPKVIDINNFEVPEPIRDKTSVKFGQLVYIPDILSKRILVIEWGRTVTLRLLESGLVHYTEEGAKMHLRALLSFTQGA